VSSLVLYGRRKYLQISSRCCWEVGEARSSSEGRTGLSDKRQTTYVSPAVDRSRSLNGLPGVISKGQAARMIYKNFDKHITRKHGIVIEGWPLSTFDNPSAIGSQMELKILLNAWQTGATRFRKMSTDEHIAWVEGRTSPEPPSTSLTNPPPTPLPSLPLQHNDPDLTLAINPPSLHPPFFHFESPAALPISTNSTPRMPGKPRKTRSDKGKPRKRATQAPGMSVFSASAF